MAKTFTLQDHFDRAAADPRHFVRAMRVWAMRHKDKSFDHNGTHYQMYNSKCLSVFRVDRSISSMEAAANCLLSSGAFIGNDKELRKSALELIKFHIGPSRLPA